ncbi:hypothetical protein M752DRAFT_279066 [Aspergillus phoenicis ATCC 13157]|uniref:Uncharacterized protein n=1 Tax=Aspergillus phoenicis ATCC 13157 TaxID=1353007 RepID=A0A370P926_ASPPH|nr:hypothetical protein M752DRAFT_279066 [Aspergillus phoenicis ATCC 13157]
MGPPSYDSSHIARSYEVLLNLSSTGEAGASATPPVSISGPDDWVTGSKSDKPCKTDTQPRISWPKKKNSRRAAGHRHKAFSS